METTEKCVYVLFSRQNTKIGRFIRMFFRDSRYSHVTVALDGSLYAMYSFSRKRHDSPFSGGFMREYPSHFLIGGRDLMIKLCRVELDDESYRRVMKRIEHCRSHQSRMLYNLYDAFALPFGRRVHLRDAYTCVDFAAYLLDMDMSIDSIGAFEEKLNRYCIYEGSLMAYIEATGTTTPAEDDYFVRRGLVAAARDLVALQTKLWRRLHNEAARV
ncbi:MAG TPA: hypothetical protein VN540_10275 [Clostridia bacterium]|nr:hypothetical protein [Clostridia bacterium]